MYIIWLSVTLPKLLQGRMLPLVEVGGSHDVVWRLLGISGPFIACGGFSMWSSSYVIQFYRHTLFCSPNRFLTSCKLETTATVLLIGNRVSPWRCANADMIIHGNLRYLRFRCFAAFSFPDSISPRNAGVKPIT